MTAAFVSELIRAANQVHKLTPDETARLLRRAAATIGDYRDQIAFSERPANDRGRGDIVFDLNVMADGVDLFSPAKISQALLEAAEVIKFCRVLSEAKIQVERDE